MPNQTISEFKGQYFFLSNFARTPVLFDGVTWSTAEHAFQAAKTFDPGRRRDIFNASSPTTAKALGRRLRLRQDWDDVKNEIMWQILISKFSDTDLADRLAGTLDTELIEGNRWHDNYWGRCFCNRGFCTWIDGNMLGKMLMTLRHELRTGRTGQTAPRVWLDT